MLSRRAHAVSALAVVAVVLACSAGSLAQGGKIVPVVCQKAAPGAPGFMCAPGYRCELQGPVWTCVGSGGNRLSAARFTLCAGNRDCDDGLFCNGVEVCMPGGPGSDYRGCIAASQGPCPANQTCNETTDQCYNACADADGDGHRDHRCGGDDCDDADPNRFPGNAEVCDAAGHDEDCNPCTVSSASTGDGDKDGDGFVDVKCSNPFVFGNLAPGVCGPAIAVDVAARRTSGRDCDDANAVIVPGTMICAGANVSICPANGPLASGTTPGRFAERACPTGTRCQPQPNGTGVCR